MLMKSSNPYHPWHFVSPGDQCPEQVNGIVEIPRGSRAKYEIDKPSGLIKLDRVLYSAVYYPANYGFIPQSLGEDGDPLDILVLTQADVVPLCIVAARVIGVMRMIDQGLADDKIIAVAVGDPSVNYIQDVKELPAHFTAELKRFFEDYTKLENKKVVVEEFLDKKTATEIIEDCLKRYKNTFVNG
jgi:inorganic pyrophosphatase